MAKQVDRSKILDQLEDLKKGLSSILQSETASKASDSTSENGHSKPSKLARASIVALGEKKKLRVDQVTLAVTEAEPPSLAAASNAVLRTVITLIASLD